MASRLRVTAYKSKPIAFGKVDLTAYELCHVEAHVSSASMMRTPFDMREMQEQQALAAIHKALRERDQQADYIAVVWTETHE